jgi:hypothetical protein
MVQYCCGLERGSQQRPKHTVQDGINGCRMPEVMLPPNGCQQWRSCSRVCARAALLSRERIIVSIWRHRGCPPESPDAPEGARGRQWPPESRDAPEGARGRHWPPLAVRGRHKPPEATTGRHRPPEGATGRQKPPEAARSRHRPQEADRGRHRPHLSLFFDRNFFGSCGPEKCDPKVLLHSSSDFQVNPSMLGLRLRPFSNFQLQCPISQDGYLAIANSQ